MDVDKLDAYLRDVTEQREDGCYNRRTNRRIAALVDAASGWHGHTAREIEATVRSGLVAGMKPAGLLAKEGAAS